MYNIILVATGGASGAVLRFILTNLSKSLFTNSIYGTLSVNILGSFFIGYLITSNIFKNFSEDFIKFFLIIGLLGSFTTFSTFSYESLSLIMEKKIFMSIIYIFFSISVCILSAYLGIIIKFFKYANL